MRVLLIGPYPPPHGGVQTNLVAIRRYLQERGIPCAVINITRHRRTNGGDVYYPGSALALLVRLCRLRYDVIHLHFGGRLGLRLLGLALTCSLIPRAKTVLTFHSGGFPESREGQRARRWTMRALVLRRLDRVVGVNQALIDVMMDLGVRPDRLRLIEPHSFAAADVGSEGHAELERFVQAHRPVLTTVGLLEPEYDLDLQLSVFTDIRDQFPNAGLAIIGSGSLGEALGRKVAAHPHGRHVLLAGDVAHGATLRAIRDSDVVLRTTLYDGDSVSVREALHLRVPVVATDNGMRPAGVTLIPKGDRGALRSAIVRTLSAARSRAGGLHDADDNLKAVLELYQELVAS